MVDHYEPNYAADPLELENDRVRPGNVVVRRTDGKPVLEIVDTQDPDEGEEWVRGVIVQNATDPDGLNFLEADKLEAWLRTGRYYI